MRSYQTQGDSAIQAPSSHAQPAADEPIDFDSFDQLRGQAGPITQHSSHHHSEHERPFDPDTAPPPAPEQVQALQAALAQEEVIEQRQILSKTLLINGAIIAAVILIPLIVAFTVFDYIDRRDFSKASVLSEDTSVGPPDKIKAYERYLEAHPRGDYRVIARNRINQLKNEIPEWEWGELDKELPKDIVEAERQKAELRIAALTGFIESYPDHYRAREAKELIGKNRKWLAEHANFFEMQKIMAEADALYYATGDHPRNPAKAAALYHQAAKGGHPRGCAMWGLMLRLGIGGKANSAQAVEWLTKGAAAGVREAESALAEMFVAGDGVSRDISRASDLATRAAKQGDAAAQVLLGDMYAEGLGFDTTPEVALMWYRKAADQDNADGQSRLGHCLALGFGVKQDLNESLKWLDKAAKQGETDARDLETIVQTVQDAKKATESAATLGASVLRHQATLPMILRAEKRAAPAVRDFWREKLTFTKRSASRLTGMWRQAMQGELKLASDGPTVAEVALLNDIVGERITAVNLDAYSPGRGNQMVAIYKVREYNSDGQPGERHCLVLMVGAKGKGWRALKVTKTAPPERRRYREWPDALEALLKING